MMKTALPLFLRQAAKLSQASARQYLSNRQLPDLGNPSAVYVR
jgi:hypothetical protein